MTSDLKWQPISSLPTDFICVGCEFSIGLLLRKEPSNG